jgi:hypothetical protein
MSCRLNVEQLLASGAMTGPHKRCRPVTLSLWARVLRAARVFFINRRRSI